MSRICLCFQVHVPVALKPYSFFDIGRSAPYIDREQTLKQLDECSDKSFLPANELMKDLLDRHAARFRMGLVISGPALRLFEQHRPDVLASFQQLLAKGGVELMTQTNDYALSFLYDREEFSQQLSTHSTEIERLFGQKPQIVAPVLGLYSNPMGYFLHKIGYKGIVCGSNAQALKGRSPHELYHPIHIEEMPLMMEDEALTQAVAQHFSNPAYEAYPLQAESFSQWVRMRQGSLVHLFWDYHLMGSIHTASSGIFDFMRHTIESLIQPPHWQFQSPSEIFEKLPPKAAYDVPGFHLRAENERSYITNSLQQEALHKLYELKAPLAQHPDLKQLWQQLQSAEHFGRMSLDPTEAKQAEQAYSHFMHIISDLQLKFITDHKETLPN